MLEKLKKAISKLESSNIKPKGFFCNAFIMCEFSKLYEQDWKLDFYDEKTNTMTSYTVNDKITEEDVEDKVYKKESEIVNELKIDKINPNFNNILKICKEEIKNNFPDKIILILQSNPTPIWNISFITKEFRLINIKIDAVTQKVNSRMEENLLAMK